MNLRSKLLTGLMLMLVSGCQPKNHQEAGPADQTKATEALISAHCGSCHIVPDPADLPRAVWEQTVLPHMGTRLGIYDPPGGKYARDSMLGVGAERALLAQAGLFPPQPLLTAAEWDRMAAYFLHRAPEALPLALPPVTQDAPFRFHPFAYHQSLPSTTMIRKLENGDIVLADAQTSSLHLLDQLGASTQAAVIGEGGLAAQSMTRGGYVLPVMGSFSPTNLPSGYLLALPANSALPAQRVLKGLHRPVDIDYADLNGDGQTDMLVCEFGKWVGRLSIYYAGNRPGQYTQQVLLNQPGAVEAQIVDLDEDGDLDILALMCQGDEALWAFVQDQPGTFRAERWLRFPPSRGSVGFRYEDLTGDQQSDLLIIQGDNADYAPFPKPYQGIYLYERQDSAWVQRWFEPLPGAYEAIPGDFDGDGDLDMAAIAFFPDFEDEQPQAFVYFERQADGRFTRHTFPQQEDGRWLVMSAADWDEDGDLDLLLGSLVFEVPGQPERVAAWLADGITGGWLENLRQ